MDELKLSCVIIDDEPAAIRVLETFCKKLNHVEIKQSFKSPIEAVKYLNTNKVDFMLLDVNMPKLSGMELMHSLKNPPLTVLTTAYSEFALESYDYDVVDYLLKPIRFTRFLRAVNKISKKIDLLKKVDSEKPIKISLKEGQIIHKISPKDVNYIESLGNYVKVYTASKNIIVNSGLQEFINKHQNIPLCRVHKSYAIHKEKITKLTYHNVILGDLKIPVGRKFRTTLKKEFLDKK